MWPLFVPLLIAVLLFCALLFANQTTSSLKSKSSSKRGKNRTRRNLNEENDVYQSQGKRPYQEDRYVIDRHPSQNITIAILCDGHGGSECAEFIVKHLPKQLKQMLDDDENDGNIDLGQLMKVALQNVSDDWDELYPDQLPGSTVVFATIDHKARMVYVLNVGDSRGILFTKNNTSTASGPTIVGVTIDQKPEDQKHLLPSKCTVVNVFGTHRINGVLAVGRALGDNGPLTKGCISREPDVYEWAIPERSNAVLLLGCDGIFDVMTSEDAAAQSSAEQVVHEAERRNSADNLTCVRMSIR